MYKDSLNSIIKCWCVLPLAFHWEGFMGMQFEYAVWHVKYLQSLAFLVRKVSIWCTIYSIITSPTLGHYREVEGRAQRQCTSRLSGAFFMHRWQRVTESCAWDTAGTRITAHGSCPSLSLKDSPAPFVMCWLHYL